MWERKRETKRERKERKREKERENEECLFVREREKEISNTLRLGELFLYADIH